MKLATPPKMLPQGSDCEWMKERSMNIDVIKDRTNIRLQVIANDTCIIGSKP